MDFAVMMFMVFPYFLELLGEDPPLVPPAISTRSASSMRLPWFVDRPLGRSGDDQKWLSHWRSELGIQMDGTEEAFSGI